MWAWTRVDHVCRISPRTPIRRYIPVSQLVDLMVKCWNEEPEARPSFSDILVTLNSIQL
jgi:hypothetical protein